MTYGHPPRPGKKRCENCGVRFRPKYANLRLCLDCYRKRERSLIEYDGLKLEINELRRRLRLAEFDLELTSRNLDAVRAADGGEAPDDNTLRWMIQKLHPDKHDGIESAQKAMKLLNAWRKRKR